MTSVLLPTDLSEAEIRGWVGRVSLARGEGYYREGRVVAPRIEGDVLSASCQGSMALPYQVQVLLGGQGIVGGHCSCPVGGSGQCKHVAALLLTWVRNPDAFTRVEQLADRLQRRSKTELVWLIGRMLRRYPDLETLLDLPIPGAGEEAAEIDEGVVERAVRESFRRWEGEGYQEAALVAHQVRDLVELGQAHLSAGDRRAASSLYGGVARAVLARYDEVYDENHDLYEVVYDCAMGLAGCLSRTDDVAQRLALTHTLFDIYLWDLARGGYGLGDELTQVFLSLDDGGERRRVADRAWEALPAGADRSAGYSREGLGGLILALQGATLSDEEYLGLSRETGRWEDHVRRLLELGRVEEAAQAVAEVPDHAVLPMANLLVSYGHDVLARDLVVQRLGGGWDAQFLAWLKDRAGEDGDRTEALRLAERIFWQRPSVQNLAEVATWGRELGVWEELHEAVVARLREQGAYDLLTRIFLAETDIPRALASLAQARASSGPRRLQSLQLEVAHATEKERPREAIALYLEYATAMIEARGRGNYAEAARYLRRVRRLLRRIGAEDEWVQVIGRVREENRRLPALQDELSAARL